MSEDNSKSCRILVAEDDEFLSDVYLTKLKNAGFQVDHAISGNEAIKMAQDNHPDLILMDLIMPDKDGFQAIEELKADARTKEIPIIVLSNLSQDEDRKRTSELGAVDFIVKANVSFKEVVEIVKKYLPK